MSGEQALTIAISHLSITTPVSPTSTKLKRTGTLGLSPVIEFPALDHNESQIRLFDLIPGTGDDSFQGSYRIASLDEENVQYQTVSYAWGSIDDIGHVTVDGSRLAVTQNLIALLRRVRHPSETVTLWIDSICINQRDDKEKTQQVNLMHRIYKQCSRCLIWMGEIPYNPDAETQEEAALGVLGAFDAIRIWSDTTDEFKLPPTLATMDDQRRAGRALRKLMCDMPWWSRIWTVQEAVAPRKARVIWGPCTIPWTLFMLAADNVLGKWHDGWGLDWHAFFPENDCGLFTAPVIGLRMAAGWKENDAPPIDMLWRFRYRQATDPRDKVFALFGLDRDDWSFLPTITSGNYYELDVVDLFKKVTIDMLRDDARDGEDRGLHALIGLRGEKKRTPGLPSWAVDWAVSEKPLSQFWVHDYFLLNFTADKGLPRLDSDALLDPNDDSIIRMNGLCFEQVVACSETITTGQDMDDVTDMLWTLLAEYRLHYPDAPNEVAKSSEAWQEEFQKLMDASFLGESQDEYWLENYWIGQRIFITETGCLSLGPSTTRRDDEVWVFSGGRYPFVMRRWTGGEEVGEADDYEMVGDAFVPAIMAGEAVLSRIHKQRFVRIH